MFAMSCNQCQWKRGSWLFSQFFVAALRRHYPALASISLGRKVKMAWLNQSAGGALVLQISDGLLILMVFYCCF